MKTYELLPVISEGGKRGHQAFEELWRVCYQDYFEITKRYPEVYAPMITMKKGFSNAIASFVCDYDEIVTMFAGENTKQPIGDSP